MNDSTSAFKQNQTALVQTADGTVMRSARARAPGLRLPWAAMSLLLLFNVADGAKNRGWLLDNQLARGTRPLTRSGYGLAVIADLNVLFGGNVQGSPANDVHVLNSKTRTWTELTGALEGSKPSARLHMGFAPGLDASIWMFGGIGRAGEACVKLLHVR